MRVLHTHQTGKNEQAENAKCWQEAGKTVSCWWQHGQGSHVRASSNCLLGAEHVQISKLHPECTNLAEMLTVSHLEAHEHCLQWLPTKNNPGILHRGHFKTGTNQSTSLPPSHHLKRFLRENRGRRTASVTRTQEGKAQENKGRLGICRVQQGELAGKWRGRKE